MSRVSSSVATIAREFETRVANPVVRWLLRSPLHPLASFALVLVTYRGRRSGREYTIPVAYARDDGPLVAVTPKSETIWWTNFREPAACVVRLQGTREAAIGELVTDDAERAELLEVYAEQRRLLGRVLGLGDRDGDSSGDELAVVRFSLDS
ncbi:nitroreductase/quinone reductase family protein [Natronobacterium texcoconense]|uniref:nitroreductase/quinone reductase family protein n=1 Tax=Natronobacterium texcoconense TaxID=1095778 RepID=UPI000B85C0B5|nr:nitroreductase/quinone reductase family protein [Natronobacterium texcoconense]